MSFFRNKSNNDEWVDYQRHKNMNPYEYNKEDCEIDNDNDDTKGMFQHSSFSI